MSTETHAKRFLTVWKRSVSTTFKRSFTVLANQIIVSETFQAFQILTNHISVTMSGFKRFSVCRVSQSKSRGLNLFYIVFFFFFFFFVLFFPISLNYNCYKINKNNSQIILWRRVSDAINRKCLLTEWPDFVAQSDALLTGDQESRIRCLPVQSGNSCLLHTIFSPETNTGYINISIMNYIKWY